MIALVVLLPHVAIQVHQATVQRAKFFEHVYMGSDRQRYTVEVSWQEADAVSLVPVSVSLFAEKKASKTLLWTRPVGAVAPMFLDRETSGVSVELAQVRNPIRTLLFIPIRGNETIFSLTPEKTRAILVKPSLAMTRAGNAVESSPSGLVHYRDPYGRSNIAVVERLWRYHPVRDSYKAGPWHEDVTGFGPLHNTISAKSRHHSVVVELRVKPFLLGSRRFTEGTNSAILLNGRVCYGADGPGPGGLTLQGQRDLFHREFAVLRCRFDGKLLAVPRHLWDTCFDCGVRIARTRLDRSGDGFSIKTFGSDGAGSYRVIWRYKQGRWSRDVKQLG